MKLPRIVLELWQMIIYTLAMFGAMFLCHYLLPRPWGDGCALAAFTGYGAWGVYRSFAGPSRR